MKKTAINLVASYLPFFILVVAIACFLQARLLMSPDVAVLFDEANRLLAGGKYIRDFFETNPPMAIYLYIPACLLVKWTALDVIFALRVYIFLTTFVSMVLSLYLLKKIMPAQDKIPHYIMVGVIGMVLFFLPMYEFGQREHFLLLLIFPYLLSAVLTLEGKPVIPFLAILIGVMAGFGFALKPFFLCALCLVELYFILKQRRLFAWVRIESLVIAIMLCVYLASIFILQPEYFKVLPLILHYYYGWHEIAYYKVLLRPAVIICWLTLIFYFIFYKTTKYRQLTNVLFLGLLGLFAAIIMQKTGWYGHVLPGLSLALLLMSCYLGQLLAAFVATKTSKDVLLIIFISMLYGIFIHDFIQRNNYFTHGVIKPGVKKALAAYFSSQPGAHSLYCITPIGTNVCFPLTYMTHSVYAGRPPYMWWATALHDGVSTPQSEHDKQFFLNSLGDDLEHYQPRWVILDYIWMVTFLQQNDNLRRNWQHYKWVANINEFRIYERVV